MELSKLEIGNVIDIDYGEDGGDIGIIVQILGEDSPVVALIGNELTEIDPSADVEVIADNVFEMFGGED